VPRHLEAWLWTRATLLGVAALACLGAGLWFLVVAAGSATPAVVQRLAALPGAPPAWSRLALVAVAALVPAALGEGLLGAVVGLVAIAILPRGVIRRGAVLGAAGVVWLGLFPVLERAGVAVASFGTDDVALAVFAAEHGLPSRGELLRLRGAEGDPDARGALALRARREGRLDAAAQDFAPLVEAGDPRWLNNAANVALKRGRAEEAIGLYRAAEPHSDAPVLRVNLSQALGSIVRLEDQEAALLDAQLLGAAETGDLADVLGRAPVGTTLDLPAGVAALAPRLDDAAAGAAMAASWRRRAAPGWLGTGPRAAAAGLCAAALLGVGLSRGLRRRGEGGDFYSGVASLLLAHGGDPTRRMDRLAELRARRARLDRVERILSVLVPGAAGLLGERPLLGLLASAWLAGAVALLALRRGPVPDPLAVGDGADLVAAGAAALLALLYVATTALALRLRERA
jgi:hypothetical protein